MMSAEVLNRHIEAYLSSTPTDEVSSPTDAPGDELQQRFTEGAERTSEAAAPGQKDAGDDEVSPSPDRDKLEAHPDIDGMQRAVSFGFEVQDEELETGVGVDDESGADLHAAILEAISTGRDGAKSVWTAALAKDLKLRQCVGTSLHLFATACSALGVDTKAVEIAGAPTAQIPVFGTQGVKKISHWRFFALWFGNHKAKTWRSIPAEFRGNGAPGALAFAGIADGPIVTSAQPGWHTQLKRGALLQLYLDDSVVDLVRAGDGAGLEALERTRGVNFCGHSCILVEPPHAIDGTNEVTLLVADQSSPRREWRVGSSQLFSYLVGCNLRRIALR